MLKILNISFCLSLLLPFNSFGIEGAEFVQLMTQHKSRISANANVVYETFPNIFIDFNPVIMNDYLQLHDLPKLFSLEELTKYGYSNSETIFERLTKYYGKNRSNLSEDELSDLENTANWLNKIENILKQEFFARHNINYNAKKSLESLEHILDVTDTGVMRKNELGLVDTRYDGQKYLNLEQKYRAGYISKWLEDNAYLDQKKCKTVLEK